VQEVALVCMLKVSVQGPDNDIVFLYIAKMRSDQGEGKPWEGPKEMLPKFDMSDTEFCELERLSTLEQWTTQGANEEFSWHRCFPSQTPSRSGNIPKGTRTKTESKST
jgi:hypothetical protein